MLHAEGPCVAGQLQAEQAQLRLQPPDATAAHILPNPASLFARAVPASSRSLHRQLALRAACRPPKPLDILQEPWRRPEWPQTRKRRALGRRGLHSLAPKTTSAQASSSNRTSSGE